MPLIYFSFSGSIYVFSNYWELLNTDSLINILQHFFSTNNIEECLQSKLNLYLLAKKEQIIILLLRSEL